VLYHKMVWQMAQLHSRCCAAVFVSTAKLSWAQFHCEFMLTRSKSTVVRRWTNYFTKSHPVELRVFTVRPDQAVEATLLCTVPLRPQSGESAHICARACVATQSMHRRGACSVTSHTTWRWKWVESDIAGRPRCYCLRPVMWNVCTSK